MDFQFPFTKAEISKSKVLLGLVEVGDDSFYDLELIARGDDDLCSRYQRIRIMLIQIIEDVLKGTLRCQPVVIHVVRHPLFYDEIFGSRFGVII